MQEFFTHKKYNLSLNLFFYFLDEFSCLLVLHFFVLAVLIRSYLGENSLKHSTSIYGK